MDGTRGLWRDEGSSIDRGPALAAMVVVLGIAVAGSAFLDARDDLYERMSRSHKLAGQLEQAPEASPAAVAVTLLG